MAELKAIHKELDLIQDVIKRMAENSFKVKAWMMSIFGGVLALAKGGLFNTTETNNSVLPMAFIYLFLVITVAVFWYLDAFFLWTERLYRKLYAWVVKNRPNTDKYLYDLNTFVREVNGETIDLLADMDSKFKVAFSKTLLPFYLIPFLFSLILFLSSLS